MIDMKAEVNGLNEKVVKMLAERKMTVSAAESCTGGLFAALITNVSGASEVLNEKLCDLRKFGEDEISRCQGRNAGKTRCSEL